LIRDFPEAGIQVLNGRYGPYITDKQRNAKIPKDKDPKSLNLEECQALLAAAPVRTFGKWGRKKAVAAAAPAAGKSKTKTPKKSAEPAAPAAKKSAAPTRLAAKGKQSAVDKKEPDKAAKTKTKAKKSPAKKKS
jgi:DNA topoisomerase-1